VRFNYTTFNRVSISLPVALIAAALSMPALAQSKSGGGLQAHLHSSASTAEAAFPATLSIDQAVKLCLERNPNATAARSGADSALATYRSAASLPAPTLNLSYANGSSSSPTVSGTNSDTFVDISESLDTSGQRRYQAAGARAQYLSAYNTYLETRLTLEQQVRDAYWSLAAARALLDYSHQALADAEKIYGLVKAQQAVGQSPRMDVVRSGIDVANAKQADLAAEGAEKTALSALNTLLARSPSLPIKLSVTLEAAFISPSSTPIRQEALIARALEIRPAVRAATQLVTAAGYSVKQNRAANAPDFSLDYQRSLIQAVDSVVVSMHMPLVDLGTTRNQVRSAEESKKQAAAQLKAIQQQTAQQVNDAIAGLVQARAQLEGYTADILKPSITLREMAQAGYREGATGILPVMDAESTLRTARTGYVNSLLALRKAEDALNAAVGETVIK
jgi:outer membrane protein TolC